MEEVKVLMFGLLYTVIGIGMDYGLGIKGVFVYAFVYTWFGVIMYAVLIKSNK